MYTRLTKVTKDDSGRDCVACANFGTDRCRIHNDIPDCIHCPMLGAILNQLCAFEDIISGDAYNLPDDIQN